MDLRSHYPYWLLRHGIVNSYPSLRSSLKTDIAIIGGGISGALVAWELSKTDYSIAVFDRRHIGTGSTAASTALLQYEIDTPLRKLIQLVGEKNAVKSYQLCRHAIYEMGAICDHFDEKGLFVKKPSFQFASFLKDVSDLKEEYQLRKKAGFSIQWLDEKDVKEKFGFNKPAGVFSKDGAEANSYLITHRLLEKCISRGTSVYDNTEITEITHHKGYVKLLTATGQAIHAKKLIIACGYESQQYLPHQVQKLRATYAVVSEPFEQKNFWYRNSLIWETADPYIYLRTTDDNRIIMGGKDSDFYSPARRDAQLGNKAKALEKKFHELFPAIPFKTDFKWAGTFGGTKDGLPYIGSVKERPNTYFALGLGGNGITFSVIAAKIIKNLLLGKKDDSAEIFSFNR